MEDFKLQCEKQYDDRLSDYRAINRYVWYQIRHMINNDLQLGRIIKIDKDGILRVNMDSRLLTDEQKDIIIRLIANERDGIYRIHRFKDLDARLENKDEYNKWFDEQAMNSFMQTIPTKEIFYSNPVSLYDKLRDSHSSNELNREDFSGYSVWQTIYALDIIDPFLVGTILGGKIEIDDSDYWDTYIKFNYNSKYLFGKKDSIELFEKNANGEFVKLDDTIHTLLFRHYQEPIFKTLNSMMYPIGGSRVMPSEGLFDDPKISELTSDTSAVLKSDNYKTLTKKYDLRRSRVSSRGY